MAGETLVTVVGNLTADPELRFTPSGAAVASFTIASTPRTFDKNSNEWKDGDALFMRCSIWRQAAENVAESLQRGMRVVAMDVDEVGPSLRYATAKVNRTQRGSTTGGGFGASGSGSGNGGSGGAPADDPWGSAPPAGSTDEPPF